MARAGDGPTLIESLTYRLSFHNTSDQPEKYQDPSMLEEAQRRDPLTRIQRYLTTQGVWDDERERQFGESVEDEVESAFAAALAAPKPSASLLFEHVFADLTSQQITQRRDLLDNLREFVDFPHDSRGYPIGPIE